MNERFALDNLSGFLKAKGLLSFRALSCFSWQKTCTPSASPKTHARGKLNPDDGLKRKRSRS